MKINSPKELYFYHLFMHMHVFKKFAHSALLVILKSYKSKLSSIILGRSIH